MGSLAFVVVLIGCSTTPPASVESDASTGSAPEGSTSSGLVTSSGEASTTSTLATSSSGVGLPDHVPPGFLVQPDGGAAHSECSQWLEDCPPGEKCMPYANDGGNAWNALRCSPIATDPAAPGEPCTVEGTGVSGIDDCEQHAMCWDIDPKTGEGTCVAMCIGGEQAPACAEPGEFCSIAGDAVLTLCLDICDPLAQDCGPGLGCYPIDAEYVCAPDASDEGGGPLELCEYINACDPGSLCAGSSAVCGDDPGCCVPFCALSDPQCPAGTACIPAMEPGTEPIGLSDVGFCGGEA